jgi:hypothetical protein
MFGFSSQNRDPFAYCAAFRAGIAHDEAENTPNGLETARNATMFMHHLHNSGSTGETPGCLTLS